MSVRRVHYRLPGRLAHHGTTADDAFAMAIAPTLARRRYDIVHCLTPSPVRTARLTRHRVVFTVLGHLAVSQWEAEPARRRAFGRAIGHADLTAAFSDAAAKRIESVFDTRCATLPIGVRLDDFAPRLDPRIGPPRLLFAGFPAEHRKRLDLALLAMPAVLDRHPDARLLVPGVAEHHTHLHELLGADRDRVLAATDDLGVLAMDAMPAAYQAATLSVLPADDEALGISLVESLAVGTPVVAADDGGMAAIGSNPAVSRLCRPGDAADLGRALNDVIALAAEPTTPAACVLEAQRWSWEVIGPQHVETYQRVITGERRGAASDRAAGA
jgi:glycosyltransferase involved in cell wall biosynthesis